MTCLTPRGHTGRARPSPWSWALADQPARAWGCCSSGRQTPDGWQGRVMRPHAGHGRRAVGATGRWLPGRESRANVEPPTPELAGWAVPCAFPDRLRAPPSDGQTRFAVLLPVTVDAIATKTAATRIATIHRVQSMPLLPSPPKAV